MKKTIKIWISVIVFFIFFLFIQRVYFINRENINDFKFKNIVGNFVSKKKIADISAEQDIVDIFANDDVVNLGNYVIAYRVPNDKEMHSIFGNDLNFAGNYYIAIQADNNDKMNVSCYGEIQYLPDIYENIIEMKLEKSHMLYIRYIDLVSKAVKEVRIPFYFASQMEESFIDVYGHNAVRRILSTQEGLQFEEIFSIQTVWTEKIDYEDQIYEISFKRVSPIYDFFIESMRGVTADYCLTVKNENEEVVSEQILLSYPVRFEEVHWLADFSGDGFMDIAFCTDVIWAKNSYSELHTLIWDPEVKIYVEKDFPNFVEERREWAMQLWNEKLSSVISFVGRDEYDHLFLEMYSFLGGTWKRVRRLQVYYAEDKYTDEGEPVSLGYLELIYSESGDVVEKRILEKNAEVDAIWFDEGSVWSRYNVENLKLYPEFPKWELIEANVNGIELRKYVPID